MTLAPGTRLGPYELVGRIGAGGMGEVWKARDPKLDRFVAVKVLPGDFAADADRLRRFQQEARVLASLAHPNVVQVFEAGEHEGTPYLVMELLEGETLRERLGGKALGAKRAAEFARDVAQGLAAAHGKGILHRDLKPENIFVTRDGRVKVLDFGLAKTRGASTDSRVETAAFTAAASEPGQVVGTSGYMSPEQVRGEAVDARSDLFSLGIVLWEMVTGAKPFRGDSSIEVMHAILKEDPPELAADLKVSPALERILHSCLAKSPEGRFHSAHDLAFALDTFRDSGSSGASGPLPGLGDRRARKALPWVGTVVLLGSVLCTALWLGLRPSLKPLVLEPLFPEDGILQLAGFLNHGKGVAFTGQFGNGPGRIYTVPLAGGRPVPMPETEGLQLDEIGPNGDFYAFGKNAEGKGISTRIPAEGGKPIPFPWQLYVWFCDLPEPITSRMEWRRGEECRILSGPAGQELAVIPVSRVVQHRWFTSWNRSKPEVTWVEGTGLDHEVVFLRPGPTLERVPFKVSSPLAMAAVSSSGENCLLSIMDPTAGKTQLASVTRRSGVRVFAEMPGRWVGTLGNSECDILLAPSWARLGQGRWLRIATGEEKSIPIPSAGADNISFLKDSIVFASQFEGQGYLLDWKGQEPMRFKGSSLRGSNSQGVLLVSPKGGKQALLLQPLDGSPAKPLGEWEHLHYLRATADPKTLLAFHQIEKEGKPILVASLLDLDSGTRTPLNEQVGLPHPDGRRAVGWKRHGAGGSPVRSWFDLGNAAFEGGPLNLPPHFRPLDWMNGGKELAGVIPRGPHSADLCAVDPSSGATRVLKSLQVPQAVPGSLVVRNFDGNSCVYTWDEPDRGRLYLIRGAFK